MWSLPRSLLQVYVVNRLDRPTSGLLLLTLEPDTIAKAQRCLTSAHKEYLVLVRSPPLRSSYCSFVCIVCVCV